MRNGAKKLQKSKQKATQGRLDMFFKSVASPLAGQKRKVQITKHHVHASTYIVLSQVHTLAYSLMHMYTMYRVVMTRVH